MRIFFHDNYLSERGTTRSIISLARALRDFGEVECYITYRRDKESWNESKIEAEIGAEFSLVPYESISSLRKIMAREGASVFYVQKAGDFDGVWVPDALNFVHTVFQSNDFHGDFYLYISSWLAQTMHRYRYQILKHRRRAEFNLMRNLQNSSHLGYQSVLSVFNDARMARNRIGEKSWKSLPYVVDLPQAEESFRTRFGIPEEACVIGSLSGRGSFDIGWVRSWLPNFLNRYKNFFWLAPNLTPWFSHERAIWIPTLISDQDRSNYITSIDAMIHARTLGELFGLAIAEVLGTGKPVFASQLGTDGNHVSVLGPLGLIYTDESSLEELCLRLQSQNLPRQDVLKSTISEFTPKSVAISFLDLISAKIQG